MRIAPAFFLAVALAAPAAAEDEYVSYYCDYDKTDLATAQVFTIGNWQELYTFYTRFAGCDHGVVTDGISYRVADLLANNWSGLRLLHELLFKHRTFKPFVFGHIDRVMTKEQADTVLDNARNHCPYGRDKLCSQIERAVLERDEER